MYKFTSTTIEAFLKILRKYPPEFVCASETNWNTAQNYNLPLMTANAISRSTSPDGKTVQSYFNFLGHQGSTDPEQPGTKLISFQSKDHLVRYLKVIGVPEAERDKIKKIKIKTMQETQDNSDRDMVEQVFKSSTIVPVETFAKDDLTIQFEPKAVGCGHALVVRVDYTKVIEKIWQELDKFGEETDTPIIHGAVMELLPDLPLPTK